ncbi:hypothetical protein HDE68_004360 [Pedobacter cryoconitis]|uniref:DUF3601 domain-containing protein n=1 Tax=Pedobacter cryoconitis TaxID=188932 RepID=A0A7W8ZQN6_9SPHI|nr:DUF3601 domain-containing protein [Pedobacter cryoconitis]MBB5638431.1 hypothetical protein [Pedobacter cryoconitis]
MGNINQLKPGKKYEVIKAFVDYDYIGHPIGETWIFEKTNFLPYEDGLTLHVIHHGRSQVYRLQWRAEEQAEILSDFESYVLEISD